MKKIIILISSFTALLIIIAWMTITFVPEKIASALIRIQLDRGSDDSGFRSGKENIVVITVGTSAPMPGDRAQTGTAVMIGDHFFMFDTGAGVVRNSENMGLPLDELDGVFLTHFHSDHIIDLPYLINRSWLLGRSNDLNIYGPDSLNSVVDAANSFLSIENQHRADHHGPQVMDISKAKGIPHEFHVEQNSTEIVFQKDGITITAFDVDHEPIEPAVGYLIEYKGKKVILSGDTRLNELLEALAQNCDLMIHEVMLMSFQRMLEEGLDRAGMERNTRIIHDIQDYHTNAEEVAALAQRANVRKLVLNHFAPAPDNIILKKMYMNELKGFDGPVHLARDGDIFIVD